MCVMCKNKASKFNSPACAMSKETGMLAIHVVMGRFSMFFSVLNRIPL